jgi:hypothetical protein
MAAVASGLSPAQTYRLVLLPQAFRIVLPPLTSNFLTVFKNSALALTIGVFELTAQSRQIESFTFQGFEAFTAAPTPAGQFTWQDLVALRFAVPMQFWDPAGAYLMNQKTAGLLFTMSDANGRPIMIPSMQNPLVFTLLGSPLRIATQMPDVAPGATPVAYGNWKSAYMVANRKAITMQHDPYSAGFCSLFKFESRIGGAIVCPAAAKVCRLPGDGLPARHWVHSSDGSERGLRPRAPELYQARRPDRPPVMNSRRFVGISKKEPLQPLN